MVDETRSLPEEDSAVGSVDGGLGHLVSLAHTGRDRLDKKSSWGEGMGDASGPAAHP